jgi:hypothetical protein
MFCGKNGRVGETSAMSARRRTAWCRRAAIAASRRRCLRRPARRRRAGVRSGSRTRAASCPVGRGAPCRRAVARCGRRSKGHGLESCHRATRPTPQPAWPVRSPSRRARPSRAAMAGCAPRARVLGGGGSPPPGGPRLPASSPRRAWCVAPCRLPGPRHGCVPRPSDSRAHRSRRGSQRRGSPRRHPVRA